MFVKVFPGLNYYAVAASLFHSRDRVPTLLYIMKSLSAFQRIALLLAVTYSARGHRKASHALKKSDDEIMLSKEKTCISSLTPDANYIKKNELKETQLRSPGFIGI